MEYYISANVSGVKSYYHTDKAFYACICSMRGCHFKTWKRLSDAKRMFKRIRVGGNIKSVSLMGIEFGSFKDAIIIETKV